MGLWQKHPKKIIDLYNKGFTIKEVSKKLGCCISTVSRILRNNGVKIKRINYTGKWQKISKKIIDLYNSGLSIINVSKELGCCVGTISRILHRNKISIRRDYIEPPEGALKIRTENRYVLRVQGKKRCLRCKEVYPLTFFNIKKKDILDSSCKNCQNKKRAVYKDKLRKNPEEYCKKLVVHLKHRAKQCGVPFNIDIGYLYSILQKQKFKCFYTGIILDFTRVLVSKNRPHNLFPSVDRLVPSKGYVKNNLVWTTCYVNRMKNDLSFTDFIETCKTVLKITKNKI